MKRNTIEIQYDTSSSVDKIPYYPPEIADMVAKIRLYLKETLQDVEEPKSVRYDSVVSVHEGIQDTLSFEITPMMLQNFIVSSGGLASLDKNGTIVVNTFTDPNCMTKKFAQMMHDRQALYNFHIMPDYQTVIQGIHPLDTAEEMQKKSVAIHSPLRHLADLPPLFLLRQVHHNDHHIITNPQELGVHHNMFGAKVLH